MRTHLPCPDCGSHDALTDYGDHTHCFSCGKNRRRNIMEEAKVPVAPINPDRISDLPERSISADTCRKYGVWVTPTGDHVYPYFDTSGKEHRANKYRTPDKRFRSEGPTKGLGLFGQQLWEPGSAKAVTIVEGECDALAAYELLGSKYPVLSVRSASEAPANVAANFKYLDSFPEIVIAFDADDAHTRPDGSTFFPGQEAAARVAAMFAIGKVRVLTLKAAKDANDYLRAGKVREFVKEWWDAPTWTPQGLKLAKDMWDEVSSFKELETVPYPWEGLNDKTFGLRLSELVVVTADTGVGKTSIFKEMEHFILQHSERGVGIIHLEETNVDTVLGLMSITASKPLHLPTVRKEIPNGELKKYFDETCQTDRIVIWDHFGSNAVDEVLRTVRQMSNLGCKYIFLDHLSIVVSDQSGDERKQLDEISTKLKTMCMELGLCIVVVVHQNRQGQIRGTAGVEQLANMVLKLFRDKEAEDDFVRNTTEVVVQKNRFCGRTGPALMLFYENTTGRLRELSDAEVETYKARRDAKKKDAPQAAVAFAEGW